ncbi:MAG: carbamoyltransferase [bacterium]|nr:carbamoyltransferase [bacterium]
MRILGLSYMYHDSAACLLIDGEIIAASAEERFNRKKHSLDFPHHAVTFCLERSGLDINELDCIVFYEKPFLKFERIIKTYISTFPRSFKSFKNFLPLWLKYKLFIPQKIREELGFRGKIYFVDHHYAHAASAFYPSGFENSAILTTDGTGEWTVIACGVGQNRNINLHKEMRFPHSIGLLYSAVTAHLGFQVNGGEGKVMALAAYGAPSYYADFKKVIKMKDDGSFLLNMDYFSFHSDLVMTSKEFVKTFGKPRQQEGLLTQRDYDLAATLQKCTEDILISIARNLYKETGSKNLCLAGGVALNCVANHKILENTDFKDIFIQPAAGDDGGSLGSAFYIHMALSDQKNRVRMNNAFFGPSFSSEEIEIFLNEHQVNYKKFENRNELHKIVAQKIYNNKIIGYFQGSMEFGPRSLGARSILANPINPETKDVLNKRVKHREWFRPFAPAVLCEYKNDYFEILCDSPFMLLAAKVKDEKKQLIPSVTHVDGRARIQTVKKEYSPDFYGLIEEFRKISGVPMVLNTSFNDKAEPIVCSPFDAYLCFMNTDMDYLVLGDFLIRHRANKGGAIEITG